MTREDRVTAWAVAALLAATAGLLAVANNERAFDPYTVQESCADVDGHIVTVIDSDRIKHRICKTQP